jgi:hypothetical protein
LATPTAEYEQASRFANWIVLATVIISLTALSFLAYRFGRVLLGSLRELTTSMGKIHDPLRQEAVTATGPSTAAPAGSLCAGHAQQLGGESPPLNLMEVKS